MLERLKRRFKQQKGFTLVELLAVVAILGIVVAIAVPTVGNVVSDSETKTDKANRDLIENAARLANTSGVKPDKKVDSAGSNNAYSVGKLEEEGFLEEIPTNPKTESDYNGSVKRTTTDRENGTEGYKFEYVPSGDEETYSDEEDDK